MTPSEQLKESVEEFESFDSFFAGLPMKKEKIAIQEYEKYIKHFFTTHTIKLLQVEIDRLEEVKNEYKTRKRMTPFQDTLFNHAVNVLQDQISHLQEQISKIK